MKISPGIDRDYKGNQKRKDGEHEEKGNDGLSSERCWSSSFSNTDTGAAQSQQNFKDSSLKLCLETAALLPSILILLFFVSSPSVLLIFTQPLKTAGREAN